MKTLEQCSFPDCSNARKNGTQQLCSGHWRQMKQGKILTTLRKFNQFTECSFAGCKKPHSSSGYCAAHYQQNRLGRILTPIGQIDSKKRDVQGRKNCSRCKEWKHLKEFRARRSTPDGYRHWCKPCEREDNLLRLYGLSWQRYEELLAMQEDMCPVCKTTSKEYFEEFGQVFCVDHDHSCCPGDRSCGKCIRGLLCKGCNLAIGNLQDNYQRALNAASYILNFSRRPHNEA